MRGFARWTPIAPRTMARPALGAPARTGPSFAPTLSWRPLHPEGPRQRVVDQDTCGSRCIFQASCREQWGESSAAVTLVVHE
eukprot:4870561-Pyramimonas_sp.AAC.1